MERRCFNFILVIMLAGPLLGTGCAWLSGESDQLARIRKFSPSLLSDQVADAIRGFKVKAGGNRVVEGKIIAAFLPKALDRHTAAIVYKKLPYRLGREQLEKMLGQPDAVNPTSPSFVKPRSGFIVLKYNMDAGQQLDGVVTSVGASLWITLYKGWVVDCEIPGVIVY